MTLITTDRLSIRPVNDNDASFIVALLNEPTFLENIGDKNVQTLKDAIKYIHAGPNAMFEQYGFALHVVELKTTMKPVGLCGLLKRDCLPYPDLGYALLGKYQGYGFGLESAKAVLAYEMTDKNLPEVLAITSLENTASESLLEKLGFTFSKVVELDDIDGESKLYNYRA